MAICIVVYRADGRGRRFRYVLDRAEFVIGRGDVADLRLPDPAVSLNHARICRQEDRLMITDLGSRNGSVVGGAPLAEGQSVAWEFGQQLAIGPYLLCHERDVPSVEASEAVEADGTAMLARMMVEEVLGDQAQAHSLVVIAGPNLGQWLQIAARDGEATIGRGQEATLQLSDADVSRIHARLVSDRQGMLWLEDLHSKNGVRIGGESISERVTVTTGDEISLGQTVLRYGETVDVYLKASVGKNLCRCCRPACRATCRKS